MCFSREGALEWFGMVGVASVASATLHGMENRAVNTYRTTKSLYGTKNHIEIAYCDMATLHGMENRA